MQHFKVILVFIALFINSVFAETDEKQKLRFGVLSYRPKEMTLQKWQPLAQEFERVLTGYQIELLPMNYEELDKAAHDQLLDFVFTNPEHYIVLKNKIAMNAVATVIRLEQGKHPLDEFAGTIFTRADRHDIQRLADLNDKSVSAVAEHSLGGYLMQRWELEKKNIRVNHFHFTGMPHDQVIDEVLSGKADAGFVRSGVLESLEKSGKITLGEYANIKIIEPHFDDITQLDKIYALHSTDHYPEWPLSIAKHVNAEIIHKISLALLAIKPDSHIAKSAEILGFNSPADYTPVEVLMLRLHSHPDELKYFDFSDVLWRYREFALVALISSLLILILVCFLIRANRRLQKLTRENEKLLLAIEQSPSSIFITDLNGSIEYANEAFVQMTGYELSEIMGKNPRILKSGKTPRTTYEEMWNLLRQGKKWHGELVNKRKNNVFYVVLSSIVPVRETDGTINHYLAVEEDITERKNAEERIKQLAFYDSLTNLPNRRKLLDRLNYSIALSHREGKQFAVFMMDLDKFKAVNDRLGHAAGDELLKQVAIRINQRLRDSDMVARLGGDEFVVLIENVSKPEDAAQVASKLIEDLTVPFELLPDEIVEIGASIGISFYPEHGASPETLIDHADYALYQAKDNGRGQFAYYSLH